MNKIKFLFCIALLVSGVNGRAQIYIDSYRFGGVAADLILDSFPNAAGAYSLRLLDKDYAGNCIMIRKTGGGNDSTNVGFSGGYLDTTAVKNFCGTASTDTCWVRVWYDQSGNARDIRQTTNASQPRIMAGGVFFTEKSLPILNFDGVNDWLRMPQTLIDATCVLNQAFCFFAPVKRNTINRAAPFRVRNPTNDQPIYALGYEDQATGQSKMVFAQRNNAGTLVLSTSNDSIGLAYALTTFIYTGSNITFYKNNTESGSFSHSFATTTATFPIGGIGGLDDGNGITTDLYSDARFNEIIIYATDRTSDRSAINGNINRFYSIY